MANAIEAAALIPLDLCLNFLINVSDEVGLRISLRGLLSLSSVTYHFSQLSDRLTAPSGT